MAYIYKRAGSPYYQACVEVGGKSRRFSTGKRNKSEAQREADRREVEEAKALETTSGVEFTMATAAMLIEGMRRKRKPLKPATVANYKTCARNIQSVLGDFRMGTLNLETVSTYVTKRKLVTGDDAIIKDLRMLSSVMSHLAVVDKGFGRNWLKDVKMGDLLLFKSSDRKGALTEKKVGRLLAACREDYQRLFIMLAVDTGMRLREVLGLTWAEIDFHEGSILLEGYYRTKTGLTRTIPVTKRCLDTLWNTKITQNDPDEKYVFPSSSKLGHLNNVKTFWHALLKRAELEGVRIHDLRHTYASLAQDRGVPSKVVQMIMGHTTASMTSRYTQPSRQALFDGMKAFENAQHYTIDYTKPHHRQARTDAAKRKAKEDQGVSGAACVTRTRDPIITN